ncbi:MAG: peptide chain release factor N(5)-glutamine methyltransferase [Paraprevotella sp.]|nr:peptide chain release factor N(5)-glutamine methyltransferase [Paraprevotella sp.]
MNPSVHTLFEPLFSCYPEGEARAMVRHILETRFGITCLDLCMGRKRQLSSEERNDLQNIVERLVQKEPLQYILGQADFCGRTFRVAPGVLIPRPETEELTEWILKDSHVSTSPDLRIIDIGTGSGCIAITLALNLPHARVTALDISLRALDIARENARTHGCDIDFRTQDILTLRSDDDAWDIVVSNPPYVCEHERSTMEANVLEYEPASALFVPDNDPLRFYRAIGQYAFRTLKKDGLLYVEINRAYGPETVALFRRTGFREIELRKDAYGNERMIKCRK